MDKDDDDEDDLFGSSKLNAPSSKASAKSKVDSVEEDDIFADSSLVKKKGEWKTTSREMSKLQNVASHIINIMFMVLNSL